MPRILNCAGNLIDLSTPKVMGILNLTPDSFYEGSRFSSNKKLLLHVEKMLQEGATFIDVGGYSSRPGADFVSEEEEHTRVVPAIEQIVKEFPEVLLSIDTFRSGVAKAGVEAGAVMVNDISGGDLDKKMLPTVAKLQVPYIMMHMRGTPQTMTKFTDYDNVTRDIVAYFSEKIALTNKLGLNDLVIDPGFGFAKTRQQNFELLNHISHLKILEKPLLVGISRKSMIYKTLKTTPEKALNGTTVLNTVALLKGASILRVHDVKEAVEAIQLVKSITQN